MLISLKKYCDEILKCGGELFLKIDIHKCLYLFNKIETSWIFKMVES